MTRETLKRFVRPRLSSGPGKNEWRQDRDLPHREWSWRERPKGRVEWGWRESGLVESYLPVEVTLVVEGVSQSGALHHVLCPTAHSCPSRTSFPSPEVLGRHGIEWVKEGRRQDTIQRQETTVNSLKYVKYDLEIDLVGNVLFAGVFYWRVFETKPPSWSLRSDRLFFYHLGCGLDDRLWDSEYSTLFLLRLH